MSFNVFKKIALTAGLTALLAMQALHAAPSPQELERLSGIMGQAAKSLQSVKEQAQLPKALAELTRLQKALTQDDSLKEALQLTTANCPPELKKAFERALAEKKTLEDAAKLLVQGGMMQDEAEAEVYLKLINALTISEGQQEELAPAHEGAPLETPEARNARMKWWREAKFGMFIHYGLYSGLAGQYKRGQYGGCVEWIQQRANAASDQYAAEALPRFTYKSGKAEEWVKLAEAAGCKYMVLTSRHHEGFNLFDTTGNSDFNAKATKGIDIVDEYSKACHKAGMKCGYYFSLIDWSHPDYDSRGTDLPYPKGNYQMEKEGRRQFGNHEKYKTYLAAIFDQLLSNYGDVDLIWWDYSKREFEGDKAWGATALMKNLRDKHPGAVQNNRLYFSTNHVAEGGIRVTPAWKGDYSTAEHHIPATGIPGDWEACQTLNRTWGYSARNKNWTTSQNMIRELVDTVSRGGNFLLNIGPMPDGSIPEASIKIFTEIGEWMKVNGEAIYETQANPLDVELPWGRITRKGDKTTYIFIYEKPEDGKITIPCTFSSKAKASLLSNGKNISMSSKAGQTSFDIKKLDMHPAATVIKVSGKRQ